MSKEFKVGDKVRALASSASGGFLEGYIYEVSNIYKNYSYKRIEVVVDSLGVVNDWLSDNFELVGSFDDLIDVAIQAVKDDVIVIRKFHSSLLNFEKIGETNHASDVEITRSSKAREIQDAIDFIKSLYMETFVIESEDDLHSITKVNEVALLNGEIVNFRGLSSEDADVKMYLFDYCSNKYIISMPFIAIKGATVTQQKGC